MYERGPFSVKNDTPIYKRSKGLDLGVGPARIKFCCVTPPPPPHSLPLYNKQHSSTQYIAMNHTTTIENVIPPTLN